MSAGIFQKYLPSNSAISPSGMKSRYCCQLAIVMTVPGAIVSDPTLDLVAEVLVSAAHDAAPPSTAQISIIERTRFIALLVSFRQTIFDRDRLSHRTGRAQRPPQARGVCWPTVDSAGLGGSTQPTCPSRVDLRLHQSRS